MAYPLLVDRTPRIRARVSHGVGSSLAMIGGSPGDLRQVRMMTWPALVSRAVGARPGRL
ncbi:hypothetical protein ACFFX0_13840 [Citricoccus parietis]|uniref:Uncharacterized protein n=1 Tax=Citricoccus parietis TaxID=592307 RepID=A0ABV5FZW9_9MICC